ncbi:MaoC/PaaZ C-terminal domain-containing protein [Natronococcus wangiae]|uniref:MaoC/PaaZ C-terminal domain-containing protein n=1 Tax=Natronococcus wangiae TaxID=3068275 RepID=UPI00273EBA85|nr:MaoC/PaaZ C-terminal domain-containing protein [Natronococcus sp. AD5]
MSDRYVDELEPGETHSIGPRPVTRGEIVSFAERDDPQRMHVDEDAARESQFGTLIASGWHTGSISMRLVVDALFADVAVVGALGVDELRWTNPVTPGDELRESVSVTEKERWSDRNGLVGFDIETRNQNDETVVTRTDLVLVERARP